MNLTKEQIDFLREEGVKEVYSGGIPFIEQKAYILQQRIDKAIDLLKTLDEDTLSNMQLSLEIIGHIEYILKGSEQE